MKKLLSNPIFILGAVYVGYKMIKKKPTGMLSQTFDEIVDGGGRIIRTVGKSATSIVDEAVSTGRDIIDIYDDGAVGDWMTIETGVPVIGESILGAGCMDVNAPNYDSDATTDDGSCE
tara:strand:- start:3953 stop:4306 length:354 start_codon:yes stop_codon:yes gene_type:complete